MNKHTQTLPAPSHKGALPAPSHNHPKHCPPSLKHAICTLLPGYLARQTSWRYNVRHVRWPTYMPGTHIHRCMWYHPAGTTKSYTCSHNQPNLCMHATCNCSKRSSYQHAAWLRSRQNATQYQANTAAQTGAQPVGPATSSTVGCIVGLAIIAGSRLQQDIRYYP
jgi:hypothetical protein